MPIPTKMHLSEASQNALANLLDVLEQDDSIEASFLFSVIQTGMSSSQQEIPKELRTENIDLSGLSSNEMDVDAQTFSIALKKIATQ